MSKKLELSFACGDYEITRPLIEGAVKPDGIELTVLTGAGSRERHWRMARNNEYDICEFNACAYFMARDRGAQWTAIPVFLHRRFRHGFVFINTTKGIKEPDRPHRAQSWRHEFSARRQHLGSGNSRRVFRRAAQEDDLDHRARRGHRVHAAAGTQNRNDPAAEIARRYAGCRRTRRHDLADVSRSLFSRETSALPAFSQTTRKWRSSISAAQEFSPSCT